MAFRVEAVAETHGKRSFPYSPRHRDKEHPELSIERDCCFRILVSLSLLSVPHLSLPFFVLCVIDWLLRVLRCGLLYCEPSAAVLQFWKVEFLPYCDEQARRTFLTSQKRNKDVKNTLDPSKWDVNRVDTNFGRLEADVTLLQQKNIIYRPQEPPPPAQQPVQAAELDKLWSQIMKPMFSYHWSARN